MIDITFKNVGQGDSIIIEWVKDEEKKIAIVDCKTHDNKNPVLEHIIQKNYERIEFMILSHPHKDHYSGFNELINHCIRKNITIGYFFHTTNGTKGFFKGAFEGLEGLKNFELLFKTIRDAELALGMVKQPIQGKMFSPFIKMTPELKLEVLDPLSSSIDKYATKVNYAPFEEEEGNLPSANWLSTVLKIYHNSEDWFVLLTSDVHKDLLYFDGSEREEYKGRLVLCQSPHHGSVGNFRRDFWKKLNKEGNPIPYVFSVGHNSYDHPGEDVVKKIRKLGYKVYATNQVGALAGIKVTKELKDLKTASNMYSVPLSSTRNDKLNGDQQFHVEVDGKVTHVV